jgi:very-short-patch-repair endonuclease
VVSLVERAVLEGWADRVAQADARLRDTRSHDRDRLVEEFRELDRELIRRSAARVIERCNELRPLSTVGQAGIIQAQASLRRRHKPIRRLLAEAGDVAKRLKPCFMMSPLSVSSFLPADIRFDVVVFDEASQVRPCDSINCIYRAERLIVAGDDKQLPPTSFFDARVQENDGVEDDETEVQEYDSILDQCKGSGFPSLSLQWHYRSQHESLIAFSNASFYDRNLLTFPGALAYARDLGVQLYRVGGTYRSRPHNDNPVEAAKVAERVLHYADLNTRLEQPLTVGVVTFSDAQEDCVLRAIEDARVRRPDLDGFFRADRLKGFFVKNLESVQGDERDVMIFSVGYAYDPAGSFALRMGPLTASGGERRLNVAITRARRRVEVVASVGPEDFRGEVKEGGGVWHLREYLAYVGRGGVLEEAPRSTGRSFDSDLEESVAGTLESWGYRVEPQVGMARYRVDLGVRRPDDPSRFLMGVECDGAMYHSSRVARDRDRLRHMVLTGLGWKLHRIWSPAWYRDRPGEEQHLRAALEEAAADPPEIRVRHEPEDMPQPEVRVVEPEAAGPPPWTLPYRVANPGGPRYRMEMHTPEAGGDIRRMIMEVVEVEAPVAIELTLRRIR